VGESLSERRLYSSEVQQPQRHTATPVISSRQARADYSNLPSAVPVATDQKVGGSSPSERAQVKGPLPVR